MRTYPSVSHTNNFLYFKHRCELCPVLVFNSETDLEEHLVECGGGAEGVKQEAAGPSQVPLENVKTLTLAECHLCQKPIVSSESVISQHMLQVHGTATSREIKNPFLI